MSTNEPAGPTPAANATRLASSGDRCWLDFILRVAATGLLVGGYYAIRKPLLELIGDWYTRLAGGTLDPSTPRAIIVILLLAALVFVWRRIMLRDPRFQAPMLITAILAVGDASFRILEDIPVPPWLLELTGGVLREYSPTFLAILATIAAELLLGRLFWGKWPHLASAYISGISVGILIHSPELWPYIACGLISICSKYVLRVGGRHIWNPSNFGVTMMLLLAPAAVASLSVQAGNSGWPVVVIWILGSLIMYRLGLFHIPLAFVSSFVLLSFFRSYVTGDPWQTEIAPITSPMFQLFMFFMITDPKTITKKRWSQVLVAVLVAVMETFLRLVFKDVHSLYHCLFIVGPAANLVQIYADKKRSKALVPSVPSVPPAPATIAAGDALADGVTAQRPDATEPRTVAAP
jgi:hypothetical protein